MGSSSTLSNDKSSVIKTEDGSNGDTFALLKSKNLIPADSHKLSSKGLAKCPRLSDFKKLSETDKIAFGDLAVVCDDVLWASKDSIGFWSYDKDGFLWRTAKRNRMITKYEINKGEELQPVEPIVLIMNKSIIKGGLQMADQNVNLDSELNDLVNKVDGSGKGNVPTEPKEQDSFTGTDKSEKTDAQKEAEKAEKMKRHNTLMNSISQSIEDVELANSIELNTFNRETGSLIGYITGADSKVMASAPKKPMQIDGKFQLTAEAKLDPVVSSKHSKGEKVPQSNYVKQPSLVLKEAAPTTHLGTVLEIPLGGLVSTSAFNTNQEIKFDNTNKDLVIMSGDKDKMAYTIMQYFGGKIYENKITHGASAGELTVTLEASVSKKDGTPKTKLVHKSSARKRIITATNYIPRKVYNTVPFNKLVQNANAEELAKANLSMFHKFFDAKDAGKIYDHLDNQSKALIARDDKGVITSEYIKVGGKGMAIPAFHDSDKLISNPLIPLKLEKEKAAGGKTYAYETYDVLNPKTELATLDPQTNEKFSLMVKALAGRISVKELVKSCITVKTTESNTAQRRALKNDEARKFIMNQMRGKTVNVSSDMKLTKATEESLTEQISELKYKREA